MLALDLYQRTKQAVSESLFLPLLSEAGKILTRKGVLKENRPYRIELTMVGERAIQKLNRKYRGKDKLTDVISLSYFDQNRGDGFAGELFICLSVAKKQAKKLNHSLFEELRFLFVHGLLHLFGYDHTRKKDEKKMTKLTEAILKK